MIPISNLVGNILGDGDSDLYK